MSLPATLPSSAGVPRCTVCGCLVVCGACSTDRRGYAAHRDTPSSQSRAAWNNQAGPGGWVLELHLSSRPCLPTDSGLTGQLFVAGGCGRPGSCRRVTWVTRGDRKESADTCWNGRLAAKRRPWGRRCRTRGSSLRHRPVRFLAARTPVNREASVPGSWSVTGPSGTRCLAYVDGAALQTKPRADETACARRRGEGRPPPAGGSASPAPPGRPVSAAGAADTASAGRKRLRPSAALTAARSETRTMNPVQQRLP